MTHDDEIRATRDATRLTSGINCIYDYIYGLRH